MKRGDPAETGSTPGVGMFSMTEANCQLNVIKSHTFAEKMAGMKTACFLRLKENLLIKETNRGMPTSFF